MVPPQDLFLQAFLPPVKVGPHKRNKVMLVFPPEHLWVEKLGENHLMDLLCTLAFLDRL